MAENNRTKWFGTDDRQQLVERNHRLVEEEKMLREHVADMYRAWMAGKEPPPPPPSFLESLLTRTPSTMPNDPPHSPYIPAYPNSPSHPSSFITRPPAMFSQCCSPPQHHLSPRTPKTILHFPGTRLQKKPIHPPRAYRKPPGSGFRPNQAYRKERLLKPEKALTPIGESFASLFERLRHASLIEPLPGYTPDPRARSFDPTARCAYHSNVRGHNIESCHTLKREAKRMIQEGCFIVTNDSDREHADPFGNLLTEVADIKMDSGLCKHEASLSS